MSVLTLWLRQFQHCLPLFCLLQCSLPCENPFDTATHHGSQCPHCVATLFAALVNAVEETAASATGVADALAESAASYYAM